MSWYSYFVRWDESRIFSVVGIAKGEMREKIESRRKSWLKSNVKEGLTLKWLCAQYNAHLQTLKSMYRNYTIIRTLYNMYNKGVIYLTMRYKVVWKVLCKRALKDKGLKIRVDFIYMSFLSSLHAWMTPNQKQAEEIHGIT